MKPTKFVRKFKLNLDYTGGYRDLEIHHLDDEGKTIRIEIIKAKKKP